MADKSLTRQLRAIALLLPVLNVAGWAFPALSKRMVNKTLHKIPGFEGRIDSIRPSLFGNIYTIKNVSGRALAEGDHRPALSFSAERITIKLDRKAMLQGQVAGEVSIDKPSFSFTKMPVHRHLKSLMQTFIPVHVRRFDIYGGVLEFWEDVSKSKTELALHNVCINGSDLSNSSEISPLPSNITLKGNAYGGILEGNIKVAFMEYHPAFEVGMEITGIQMPQLNDFFSDHGGFDVNRGTLDLYTEISARDGKFKGYIEPVIHDLDVVGPQDKGKGFLHLVKEGLLGAAAEILEHTPGGQLATKIPFNGTFNSPHVHTAYAIYETLLNAFCCALKPSVNLKRELHSIKNDE